MDNPESPPSPGRRIRPLLSLQRHWRTGLLVAAALLLIGLPLAWLKGQSSYVAEAVFQVYPTYQKNLSADKELELQSNSQYREFVNHLSRSVVRYDVVERAMEELKGTGCLAPETRRKCIERLQRVIYVLPIPDTYMVRVGLRTEEKGESDQVINKVMEIFLNTVRDEQIFGASERAAVLKKQAELLRTELGSFEVRRAVLAGKLGLTTFNEHTSNPYDALLAKMREQLAHANVARSTAQAHLRAFEAKREVPMQAGRSVLEMRLQDNGLQALRNEVVKRSEELGRLLSGLEPSHPAFAPAQREREEITLRLQTRESDFDRAALDNARARLSAGFLSTQQVENELIERVEQLESKASAFATDFRSAIQLTTDIRKREQEINDIRDRSNFLKTERDAIGFARLITPALPATAPQGIGRLKLGLAIFLASLLCVLVVPVAIDRFDGRIIAVSDAEKVMGIASAAWFVDKVDQASATLSDDQHQRFASSLMRNRSRGAHSVFAFTAARVGGGCTGVVTGVAKRLAALGARVLVVDANTLTLNSPLHHGGLGLTDHLAGRAELADIVVRNSPALPGIALVGLGTAREGGLQHVDKLRLALQTWQEQYDLVLLDVPPLLPSADAELLIDLAKQVFLVVEAMGVSKTELAQVRTKLSKQAPEAVGLVVNKVSMEQGSATLNEHILESITGSSFSRFMSTPDVQLRFELLRIHIRRALSWRKRQAEAWQAG